MSISVFRSNPALFRAMGVSSDEAFAFADPMNTMADGDATLSEGESGYADLSSQPDNVAQDFSPASSISRAKALRYDWYGGERFTEFPATEFLERLLDPFARVVRAAPANLVEELKREARELTFVPIPFAAMPPASAAIVSGIGVVAKLALPDHVAQGFSPASPVVAQDFSPAGSIGRAEALRYTGGGASGNDKVPRRFEGSSDSLLAMPGPDGEGVWGALKRFQDRNPLAGRSFGIRGAGKTDGAVIKEPTRNKALFRRLVSAGIPVFDRAYAKKPAGLVRLFNSNFGDDANAVRMAGHLMLVSEPPNDIRVSGFIEALDAVWFHLKDAERDRIGQRVSGAVQKMAKWKELAGVAAVKALYDREGRIELPDISDPTSEADTLAVQLNDVLHDRLVTRLEFLLNVLEGDEAHSLRQGLRHDLMSALTRMLLKDNVVAPFMGPTSPDKLGNYDLGNGPRKVTEDKKKQLQFMVKWLGVIRPLMDELQRLRGKNAVLSHSDLGGLRAGKKKDFRDARDALAAYLAAVSNDRSLEEQDEILRSAAWQLGWQVADIGRIVGDLDIMTVRGTYPTYKIEGVTVDGREYLVLKRVEDN